MISKDRVKTFYLLSVFVHLLVFVGISLFVRVAQSPVQAETYEIVPLSKPAQPLNSKTKEKSVEISSSPKNGVAEPAFNETSQGPQTAAAEVLPSEKLPTVQSDHLLISGVQILNIDEVTRSVKRTPEAVKNNIEGKVKLKLLVDEKGQLRQTTAMNSLGFGLDEVAVQAAKKLIFIPAKGKSGPVAVEIYYTVKFTVSHQ